MWVKFNNVLVEVTPHQLTCSRRNRTRSTLEATRNALYKSTATTTTTTTTNPTTIYRTVTIH